MTRQKAKDLRELIQNALNGVAGPAGVDIRVGNCRFGTDATFQVIVSEVAADGTVKTREADDFRMLASSYGLEPEDLGRSFRSNGDRYTIAGLKPRSRKYPILAKRGDGKIYKFGAQNVKVMLGVSA